MKDEALRAREWFLGELQKLAKKSGKPIHIFGRAEYEQRLKDESENSFSPKLQKDQESQPQPEATPSLSDPERAKIYGNSGDEKIGDRDYQGAIEDLSEAIRLDPKNHSHYSLRGVAYYELGRHEEALTDYSKSIEILPSPANLYNRAEVYYKNGRDNDALDDLDHALKLAHEIPGYNFIIPVCQKLISIIKDTSLSREDYYQAPIGWENMGSRSTEPDDEAFDDVGPEVIAFVYESMRVDDEWSIRSERGFTWWGHQLAQRVWAEDVRRDDDTDVTLMRVETDFLRDVENSRKTYEVINDLNAGTSQFVFHYNPQNRYLAIHSTVYTHRQSLSWSKRYFLRAAGLQLSYAHRMAEKVSHLFPGSEPDTSPHPENGFRPVKDELVDLISNFYIPMSDKEPTPTSDTFQFTKKHLEKWFMVYTRDNGLTAEFPFTGDEPVYVRIAQGKRGVVTSLFTVNSTGGHPLLGKGLMMRMKLPIVYERENGLRTAMALNLMEATNWVRCHLNGAWYIDEKSTLVFVSFFPLAGFKDWELANIALNFAIRSRWAAEVIFDVGETHRGMLN